MSRICDSNTITKNMASYSITVFFTELGDSWGVVLETLKIIMLCVLETLFFYKKWNESLEILFSLKKRILLEGKLSSAERHW